MSVDKPIEYFNRYTGELETEEVYGEPWLRWAYGSNIGQLGVWAIAKRLWFTHWYGARMRRPKSAERISDFIYKYKLDSGEWEKSPQDFESFNDFFVRRLKPEARTINPDPNVATFPADGRHWGCQDISKMDGVYVKGQKFDLAKLLGTERRAERYMDGALVLSRLAPVDYHRFHFPDSGISRHSKHYSGHLQSVNPIALRQQLNILGENRRVFTRLRSDHFGWVVMVEVGATCVGSIVQTYTPRSPVKKGDEKGFFQFGGSAVVTLFEKGKVQLADDLLEQSAKGFELYAHMGDEMGRVPSS